MKFSSFSAETSVTVHPEEFISVPYVTNEWRMLIIQSAMKGKQHIRYIIHDMIDPGPPIKLLTRMSMIAEIMNYNKK